MSWHKCFLCGCEYRDDSSESRFGYCPGCRDNLKREEKQRQEQQKGQSKDGQKQL